ncbi:phage tail protein [Citrobacter werkmanii]|nr:phage tail protein [Citrobacter werkmanii]
MATKYLALLTNIGAAKLAKATALGTKVEITQLAVGDGNGVLPTPNPAQTALVHELRRAPLNMLTVDPANASQIIAEQVIPEDVGGWWIREIGLFDKDGDMVAIANCAETYKPQLQEGSGRVQVIRVILIVSSTEAVTLKIDPAVVLATRQYVDNKIIEVKSYADGLMRTHEQSRNHPDATTTAKGFTQLNSSVTDDSEAQAATPKAVKIAMDNANARLAKDRNLADLPNPALARQNLQLGNSSTKNTGTTANTVAAGDDARITGAMQKSQNGADIPDVAQFLQNLGLDVALSNKQPLSDTLTKLATLGPQTDADQVLFFSGKNIPAVSALTLAGRQFISKENVPDMLQYLTLGDGSGRLLGVQVFGTSGMYCKSPGVKKIIVEAVGGGGASGNLSATASNNCGISAAGSPGSYAKAYYYENIPATVAITIGSGGVAGTGPGGSGGDGGQTSFGSLVVCPGGKGSTQAQQVPPFSGGSATEASPPTGAGLLFHSVSRSQSCAALGIGTDQAVGLESTIATALGIYGKGGTGVFNPANSVSTSGVDGGQGYILVWEYQ